RHLAFFPQFGGERLRQKGGLDAFLGKIRALSDERTVCVLASGDPLFFGIGARVAEVVGAEHVEFVPAPTAVQWAFARTGVSWDDADVVSVHGRTLDGFAARLRSSRKAAVLTDP